YQNDVRVLTDGILEGLVPVDAIQADFALIDHRLLVGEGEFDRVFDGQDVQGFPLVDVVKHGGNGGALAAAGDTGQDDQPFRKITQLFNTGRQAQLFEAWNNIVDAPGHQRQSAALLEQTDAEAALVLADHVGKVHTAFFIQDFSMTFLERG